MPNSDRFLEGCLDGRGRGDLPTMVTLANDGLATREPDGDGGERTRQVNLAETRGLRTFNTT